MSKKLYIVAVLIAVFSMSIVSVASATSPQSNPWLFSAKASAKADSSAKVTLLAFVQANGISRKVVRRSRCRVIGAGTNVPGYYNSGRSANGGLRWFWDTKRTKICRVGGRWRKVLCGNFIRFTAPKRVVKGPVVMVRTFGKFSARVSASVSVKVSGYCGYAQASASASASARGLTRAQARGNAQAVADGRAYVSARARASVSLSCAVTQVTPPPPGAVVPEKKGDTPGPSGDGTPPPYVPPSPDDDNNNPGPTNPPPTGTQPGGDAGCTNQYGEPAPC